MLFEEWEFEENQRFLTLELSCMQLSVDTESSSG